eukprot:ANDGO_05838.mRNA.1 Eukaryotic translation initiation factor 3 subunit H
MSAFSMPGIDDRVKCVQLSALVVFKIIKHARERIPPTVGGSLVGLYTADTLEITNSLPKLNQDAEEYSEDAPLQDDKEFSYDMLRHFQKHRVDDMMVGWYSSMSFAAFLSNPQSALGQLAIQQDLEDKCVVLIFDPQRFDQALPAFRAFRLTQQFIDMASRLQDRDVARCEVYEELPVRIQTDSLSGAFLGQLQQQFGADPRHLAVRPEPLIESSMSYLVDSMNDYVDKCETFDWYRKKRTEINDRRAAAILKRQQENKARAQQKLAPLGYEDIDRSFRIPTLKYTRLEKMLAPYALDNYCDDLVACATQNSASLYVADQMSSSSGL